MIFNAMLCGAAVLIKKCRIGGSPISKAACFQVTSYKLIKWLRRNVFTVIYYKVYSVNVHT